MILDGVTPHHDPTDSESGWKEKNMEQDQVAPQYQDAFGNEEGAEVKYKTMKWWYVTHCEELNGKTYANCMLLGKPECVSTNKVRNTQHELSLTVSSYDCRICFPRCSVSAKDPRRAGSRPGSSPHYWTGYSRDLYRLHNSPIPRAVPPYSELGRCR